MGESNPIEDRGDSLDGVKPRRRRSRFSDDEEVPPTKRISILGIIALVLGIKGLCLSVIPCIGMFGLIPTGIGLLLGIISLFHAKSSGEIGTGFPISSIVVNAAGIGVACIWLALFFAVKQSVQQAAAERREAQNQDEQARVVAGCDTDKAIAISASDLDSDYEQNDAAADAKYKGKVMNVSGTVRRVRRDLHPERYTIELEGIIDTNSIVDCRYSLEKKNDLQVITAGDYVTVRGTCVGKRRIDRSYRVSLDPCTGIVFGFQLDSSKRTSRLEGRVKSIQFNGKAGTLILLVNGEEKKLKLDEDSRFFDSEGDQIRDIANELDNDRVVVILRKVDDEDTVIDVKQK
jgi:hypothetical protein